MLTSFWLDTFVAQFVWEDVEGTRSRVYHIRVTAARTTTTTTTTIITTTTTTTATTAAAAAAAAATTTTSVVFEVCASSDPGGFCPDQAGWLAGDEIGHSGWREMGLVSENSHPSSIQIVVACDDQTAARKVLHRINVTTKDVRMKKRADLQKKLQSLFGTASENGMSTKVVNLSKRDLTSTEINLASKGIKFSHTDAAPTDILANLESLLLTSDFPDESCADIFSCTTGLFRKRKHNQTLPIEEERALRSLRTNGKIVIMSADKGGTTVITDKADYVNKANQVFDDREAYVPPAVDPTEKQAAAIEKKVNELARLNHISSDDNRSIALSDPRIAPIDYVARCLEQTPIGIPTQHVLDVLRLCLKNYYQFDGKYYQQVKGTPMGSPITGLFAELILQRLEQDVVQTFEPKMWLRYVDDTFIIIKASEVEQLHQNLNSVFPDIQFTREEATGDTLPFLNVSIQRPSDGKLATSVHRKDPSAEIILSSGNNHPAAHKPSFVHILFHRAYRVCNSGDLLKKELAYLHRSFWSNGYPASSVENCLRRQRQPPSPESNGDSVSEILFTAVHSGNF
ncbi:Acyl-CoA synthetase member 2 mitochondrial [Sparganum proliferum]